MTKQQRQTARIKWTVGSAPTGRYRGFETRSWPMGQVGDDVVAWFTCKTEYYPPLVKTGNHEEIEVWVTFRKDRVIGWDWKRLKQRASTLMEAKAIAQKFYDDHPDVFVNLEA